MITESPKVRSISRNPVEVDCPVFALNFGGVTDLTRCDPDLVLEPINGHSR